MSNKESRPNILNESNRILVDMLEKEASIIIKQIALCSTMWGSVFVFLLKSFGMTLPGLFSGWTDNSSEEMRIIYNMLFGFAGILFSEYVLWVWMSAGRIRDIREKIERINHDIG
ncbi:MAG: hypothetical protein L3J47_11225 [Sulfurovum sp.]|nr:hypothetical protein [Sulfurovum sp.]